MNNSQIRAESPSFQKMQALADRWNQLKTGIDKGKFEKKEILETSIFKIDNLLSYDKINDDEKFKTIKEQLFKITEQVNNERFGKEHYLRYQEQLLLFEEQINKQMDEEKNNKRRVELQLLKQIEDRFETVQSMLGKNNSLYQDKLNRQIGDIANQLSNLKFTIENEQQNRVESQTHLIEQMDLELNKFQEMMTIEKSVREETEQKIFSMIEDVHQKIQNEIINERISKERSQESILRLLESTCLKIDESFNS
ncbi:unnamed protein product (macronuclear) [Paramecium tetraurelia]|uniref:Uncharacterized protein n=1 Tax=Paramecium tetraurelia TaxID=5888 RepID=A0E5A0_PARTE|nr:uncharacterized protein GSPATT00023644001 [Paramecium tetraurelia]CAK90467.1 unnamed protein product [Paramecium tetraurelia]|eukprot:XP_001457864.1 hypothetical protein (macronuclear) [Paramecium tetraurelia strain d4-2]